ncbi:MAG: hexokinase family protein [Cellulosilyticaceae bacterium]
MEQIKAFLSKYGMNHEAINMTQECGKFIEEMKRGLEGNDSSLEMIPTYLTVSDEIKTQTKAVVIDAGGTNFRVGTVEFDQDMQVHINDFAKYQMPGIQEELSKEAFFKTMVEYTQEVAIKATDIGFCFSYPVEINKDKDGTLLRWSKEVKAPEVVGEKIGANLVEGLKKVDGKERKVVILNDTVATLLGGKGITSHRKFDGYIGFIFGTGTNACYIEEKRNITKVAELEQNGSMIINAESGAYNKLPRGVIDEAFDQTTNNPGDYQFEKMVSGRYLGPITLRVLQAGVNEGLFSEGCGKALEQMVDAQLIDLNNFMYDPYDQSNLFSKLVGIESDRTNLYLIVEAMIERAAKLCAIKLSGMILKTGKGTNPCCPVAIVAEGTTFYKLKGYKEKLDRYMREYLSQQNHTYYEFLKGDDLNLIGTATAALSNQ